jgi:uncharacterized membrane protein YhiD involved in acid resistance
MRAISKKKILVDKKEDSYAEIRTYKKSDVSMTEAEKKMNRVIDKIDSIHNQLLKTNQKFKDNLISEKLVVIDEYAKTLARLMNEITLIMKTFNEKTTK